MKVGIKKMSERSEEPVKQLSFADVDPKLIPPKIVRIPERVVDGRFETHPEPILQDQTERSAEEAPRILNGVEIYPPDDPMENIGYLRR